MRKIAVGTLCLALGYSVARAVPPRVSLEGTDTQGTESVAAVAPEDKPDPPKVVDATGKTVGLILSHNGLTVIGRRVGNVMVGMTLDRHEFKALDGVIAYTGPGCTGARFVETSGMTTRQAAIVFDPSTGRALRAVYPANPIQTIVEASFAQFLPPGFCVPNLPDGSCCIADVNPPITVEVGPVGTLDLSSFIPPFEAQ